MHLKKRLLRCAAALCAAALLLCAAALPAGAAYSMPIKTANADESVYLFNVDTGKVILEQNTDTPRYIASLTKMMTALLVMESGKDLLGTVTVPESLTQELSDIRTANGATAGFKIGEQVRRIDLLYALLLPSANDAASILASDIAGGSLVNFVAKMNQRAAELGCTDTNFTCVHGLYDYGNVSTAKDLAKIALACRKIPELAEIVEAQSYELPATNYHSEPRTIKSTNLMQDPENPDYRAYIHGFKTGFTTLAGRCFVTFATEDTHTYGLVVLGSTKADIYAECGRLLDWALENFNDMQLLDTQTPVTTAALSNCRTGTEISLYPAASLSAYGSPDDEVSFQLALPDRIKAPISEGTVLGRAEVLLDGYAVGSVELIAHESYHSAFYTDAKAVLLLLPFVLAIQGALFLLTISGGAGQKPSRRAVRRRAARR